MTTNIIVKRVTVPHHCPRIRVIVVVITGSCIDVIGYV
jgi:hypothetical protein